MGIRVEMVGRIFIIEPDQRNLLLGSLDAMDYGEMQDVVGLDGNALPRAERRGVPCIGSPRPDSHCERRAWVLPQEAVLTKWAGSVRSASIPLPSSHILRTESEIQLDMDEAAAEQREIRMFYRMVNGIRDRQRQLAREQLANAPPRPPRDYTAQQTDIRHGPLQAQVANEGYPVVVSRDLFPMNSHDTTQSPSRDLHDLTTDVSDEWSITGYDTDESQQELPYCDITEDDGIFDIDV